MEHPTAEEYQFPPFKPEDFEPTKIPESELPFDENGVPNEMA